jgi:uncharacterized protein YndB with AHSA1/START domain
MSERSVTHATFVVERSYDASPARVFAAWATPKAKARWFVGPDEWEASDHELDFRVGGRERVSGGPKGGPVHAFDARYQDIVPNERIVSTYDMHLDETRISVSLATVEFKAEAAHSHDRRMTCRGGGPTEPRGVGSGVSTLRRLRRPVSIALITRSTTDSTRAETSQW